jgi:hypothetical protein
MGRTLIYIPIIHTSPDLGSLAKSVEKKAERLIGSYWEVHKRTVERYWQEIERLLERKKFFKLVIFQDGLPEGGKTAQAIIDRLARTGSPNYQLLKRLTKNGAQMQKTEDIMLLKQEYQLTKDLASKKNLFSAVFAFLKYKLRKNGLLKARDNYIANQINQNLTEGEIGICFLGAYHAVLSKLASDINIVLVKNPDKVKEYYKRLTQGETMGPINDLARYLTKPIKKGLVTNSNKL